MASFFLQIACLMCALVGAVSGEKATMTVTMSFEANLIQNAGSQAIFEPWKTWAECNTLVGGPEEPTDPEIITEANDYIKVNKSGKFSVHTVTDDFANKQGEQKCAGNHDADFGFYMRGGVNSNSFCNTANTEWSVQVWMGPGVTGCTGSPTEYKGSNDVCDSEKINIKLPSEVQKSLPSGVNVTMAFLMAIKGNCKVDGSTSESFSNAVKDASKNRPSLAAPSSSSSTCFPAQSTVQLDNGDMVRMDALQVGHKVQVGAKETSEVFMFSHQYTDAQATFVELTTASGAIRLTPGHYLYVNGAATQARAVKVGDHLEAANGTPAAVTGVTQVRDTGLYNPHTMHGDVVVNGFRTTTYTDAIHPTMAHALLAPARAMYAMNVTF